MEKEVTNSELLEAIAGGFSKVESRFQKIVEKIESMMA